MADTLTLQQHADARKWRWFGWLRGRSTPEMGTQHSEPGGGTLGLGVNGPRSVSDERAMTLSTVFSCGRLISELVGYLPLDLYERMPGDERRKATDHKVHKLLQNPNPEMTGQEFREALTLSVVFWGNGYAQKIRRASDGVVLALYPLRPERMKVERVGRALEYTYTVDDGTEVVLDPLDVFHIKGFGDGWVGFSVLGYMRSITGQAVAQEEYSGKFYANDAKQSGILSVDRVLKAGQREAIAENFAGLASASDKSLFILEADMKFQPLTLSPADAQYLESRRFSVTEICRFFRVPPHMVFEMDKASVWGSGLEQQNMGFLQYSLSPYFRRWENSANKRLLLEKEQERYYAEHNPDGLLMADTAGRNASLREGVNNGWLTRNEARKKQNLPRSEQEGADDLTIQSAMAPLDALANLLRGSGNNAPQNNPVEPEPTEDPGE